MSGKYDLDRDLYIRKLRELREPGRPLCKHDWVGDDDCAYCRNEELEYEIMKTKGMSSLNEDDVRRICREEYLRWKQQASDTETPASQASSEVPAEEGTPPWQDRRVGDRRKIPEPKCYKG